MRIYFEILQTAETIGYFFKGIVDKEQTSVLRLIGKPKRLQKFALKQLF